PAPGPRSTNGAWAAVRRALRLRTGSALRRGAWRPGVGRWPIFIRRAGRRRDGVPVAHRAGGPVLARRRERTYVLSAETTGWQGRTISRNEGEERIPTSNAWLSHRARDPGRLRSRRRL